MKFLYPKLRRTQLPALTGITLLGGLAGGIYGICHDLITYSISSEYFTRMKFVQFEHVDIGFPPHLFAAQIGFIAAGAVGLAAGWFIARTAVPIRPARVALQMAMRAFLLMILIAAATAVAGYVISIKTSFASKLWKDLCESLGVSDVSAFLQVAMIHTAGYVGALAGLIVAIVYLRRSAHQS